MQIDAETDREAGRAKLIGAYLQPFSLRTRQKELKWAPLNVNNVTAVAAQSVIV
jgi:hypothetical protein